MNTRKIISVLLATCFILTVAAGAVSAHRYVPPSNTNTNTFHFTSNFADVSTNSLAQNEVIVCSANNGAFGLDALSGNTAVVTSTTATSTVSQS